MQRTWVLTQLVLSVVLVLAGCSENQDEVTSSAPGSLEFIRPIEHSAKSNNQDTFQVDPVAKLDGMMASEEIKRGAPIDSSPNPVPVIDKPKLSNSDQAAPTSRRSENRSPPVRPADYVNALVEVDENNNRITAQNRTKTKHKKVLPEGWYNIHTGPISPDDARSYYTIRAQSRQVSE